MAAPIDYEKRPDLRPGFWPQFVEPTRLGRAIQMPLHPAEKWQASVLNAYSARRPLPPPPSQDREPDHD